MGGRLEELYRGSGAGFASFDSQYGGISLGTGPGSRRRGGLTLVLPRPENSKCGLALVSVGVRAKNVAIPFRWRLVVDGSTLSREFKPQFRVEADDSIYYRVVYDAKPLLESKLLARVDHRVQALYDGFQPIVLSDASILAVFNYERAQYSISYHTGAYALSPGDLLKVDANIGNSFGGGREALVSIYMPSPHSTIEIIAGGSPPQEARGPGHKTVKVGIPYKGYLVPVAIRYRESSFKFYPKTAIVTDIIVLESLYPFPNLKLNVENVEFIGERLRITGYVENTGDDTAKDPLLVVLGMGVQLVSINIGQLDPGERRDFTVMVDTSKLPVKPTRLNVRVIWKAMGETKFDDVIIKLATSPS